MEQSRLAIEPAVIEAWALLGMAFIGSFDTAKHRDPYGLPASTAVTAEKVHDLQGVVPNIAVAAVRARLADLIWLRARGHAMARLAVDSFLEAARQIEDPANWVFCARYSERSARLATQLRVLDHEVFDYLEELASKYRHGESCFLTMEAIRVLAELRPGTGQRFIPLLHDVATAMTRTQLFFVARQALQQTIELARRMNKPAIEREAHREIGQSFEAEAAVRAASGTHGVAASFYHSAIKAYQAAGRSSEAIDRVRPLLEVEEQAALPELKRIEAPFDPTHMIAHAIKAVSGKPLPDALFAFATLLPLCDYDELRQKILDIARQAPLSSMLSGPILGGRGRTVAHQRGMNLSDSNEDEQAIIGRMHRHLLRTRRQIDAQAYLIPALQQLNLEHDITLSVVGELVFSSAIVPNDRQLLFARGIFAGFDYDFMTAMHFLIPQFENVLRQMLRARRISTTFFKDGAEREYDLNVILHEPRLEEIMPKGAIFELQCFLIDQRGSNFRHQMAHGMFADDAFSSTDALFIWWLILHLTFAFRQVPEVTKPTAEDSEEEQNTGADDDGRG
jgi:hypothetical protein